MILGTSDIWSTSHLSQRPSELVYYIVDFRISSHLCVSFSRWRKYEGIERNYKTQNPTHRPYSNSQESKKIIEQKTPSQKITNSEL